MTARLRLGAFSKRPETAIFGAFLALAALTRLPVLTRSVLDWDESLYLIMAGQWRLGHLPYTTIWDNKPLGIYAIFAAAELLLGRPLLAMRVASIACAGISAFLVYVVIRRLGFGQGRGPALFGGAAFLIASLGNDGLAANTEPFMAGATLLAVALASRPGRVTGLVALGAGAAVGAAFMIKYVSVLETPAVFFLLLSRPDQSWRRRTAIVAAFTAGAALPLLATILLYWRAGALPLWWSCAVLANFRRAGAVIPPGALAYAARIEIARWGPLYVAGLAVLAAAAMRWRRLPTGLVFLSLWLVGGCLGVAAARSFYDHYFLQILPALCVCLGWCAARLGRKPRLALLLGALALAPPALAAGVALREATGPDVTASMARELAAPLAARPGGLYVFDSQPILYVLTGETPPTRYAFPSVLTTGFLARVAAVDAPAEIKRILALKPLFIVRRPAPPRGDNPIDPKVYALMDTGLAGRYRLWRRYSGADIYQRR